MNRKKIILRELRHVYGQGSMVVKCAEDTDRKYDSLGIDGTRDRLMLHLWNWFSGGSTAEYAADRIRAAIKAQEEA